MSNTVTTEESTKALAEIKIDGNFPVDIRNMDDMKFLGSMLATSGFFSDTKSVAQAVVKVLAGAEVGIGPIAAMSNINIVKGKPSFGSNLIAAQIKRHPNYDYRVKLLTNDGCEIEFFEMNGKGEWESLGDPYVFSRGDAQTAGLLGKDNWKNYPRAMMFSRCISAGARTYCPDVFYSHIAYTPEELDPDITLNESGDILEGQIVTDPVTVEPGPEADELIAEEELEEELVEEAVVEPEQTVPEGRPWMDTTLSIPDARNVLYAIAIQEWSYEDEEDVRITVKDSGKWSSIPDLKTLDEIADFLMEESPLNKNKKE
jgi:hypothetical protein